jgi:3-hydroxyacyl-CoA dehydrogenase/enoyl-CoA hydratase/3-hydroxybutyryl-CoA epimerase
VSAPTVATSPVTFTVDDGIAVVTFDLPGSAVNTFTRAARESFASVLGALEQDEAVRGVVVLSGKPDTWIAGADIEELRAVRRAEDAERLSREGQAMLERVARARVPIVAAIHGACLGGGLEFALACRHRIASDHAKTVLALPEVQLGLLPGAGGTQRLPRLVGLQAALDLMLTGKNVRGKKALQLGLVDELVHPAILREVGVRRARELAAGVRVPTSRRSRGATAVLLEGNPFGRALVFRKARESVLAKTKGQYPAPLAILDVVQAGLSDADAGYQEESRRFGELTQTDVSRQLTGIFFATTAMKKETGLPPGDAAPAPRPVDKVGIVGTGFMGAGIAAVTVQQGIAVRFKDTAHERVAAGLRAVRGILQERLKRKAVTRQQCDDQFALVAPTIDYTGFANVPLVIEAVFEDLTVKHAVLRELEPRLPPHAVFATNTSTIPVTRIAEAAARPERVLGLHFFSPVHKMPLLEVIVTPQTAPDAVVTAVAFGRRIGKTIIVVRDGPGFYVNRILAPYINEAGRLLDDGASIEEIDAALTGYGFPVGPITLLDEVGLDIAAKSGAVMLEAFGARMQPSLALQAVVGAGRLGRKGKQGFYRYDADGAKGGVDESVYDVVPGGRTRRPIPAEEIVERCTFAMLNEAARCLEDGVLRSPRDGDIGAVFGIGFPPFRGGPFRVLDALGASRVAARLEELDARFPGRFAPCDLLLRMARRGERFHHEGEVR